MHKLRAMLFLLAFAVVAILAGRDWYLQRRHDVAEPPAPASASIQPPAAPGAGPNGANKATPISLNPREKLTAARQLIAGRLNDAPEFAPFFETFQKSFPAAHTRAFDNFAETAAKGGHVESADLYLAQALRSLRSSHGILASNASPEVLMQVFDMQAAILKALSVNNPGLCADFLYGAASEPFFLFSKAHRKLVADMAEASLKAIMDGKEKGIQRTAPDAKEFAELEAALRAKGLEKPEIEMLLDAKTPEPPLADTTVCRSGIIYFETLRALPEETRTKIYALAVRLLARS